MERTDATPVLAAGGLVAPPGAEVAVAGADPVLASRAHGGAAAAAAGGRAARGGGDVGGGRRRGPRRGGGSAQPALSCMGAAEERRLGGHQVDHPVAEELQPLVVDGRGAAVGQRVRQQRRIGECMADPVGQHAGISRHRPAG